MLSVVIPVYKGELFIYELINRIEIVCKKQELSYELIMVDDFSPDNSWNIINSISIDNSNVIGIKLLRNFGQHPAIIAGLSVSKGDHIIVMDCDLQDLPEEIPALLEAAKEGYDIVFARRTNRTDSFFKKLGSKLFYKFLNFLTDKYFDSSVANFGVYSRNAVDNLLKISEHNKYLPLTIQWFGFSTIYKEVKHGKREHGKSNYSFSKLMHLGLEMVISFSTRPLYLVIKFGAIISLFSLLSALLIIILKITDDFQLGWASLIVSISFFSGIIIFTLGIIGLYVGRVFEESRNRPVYIIEKTTNLKT